MGKYLDIFRGPPAVRAGSVAKQLHWGYDKNDLNDKRCSDAGENDTLGRLCRFCRPLSELERRRPDHVDAADWQQAVEDARRFVSQWGDQAEALGWTDGDLFGLHEPPKKPAFAYRRLSRNDQTGLIWLLRGRRVIAVTASQAVIRAASGATLTFRKPNNP